MGIMFSDDGHAEDIITYERGSIPYAAKGGRTDDHRLESFPDRLDLRVTRCQPYLMIEDQGDSVSCVSHAFSMAYYCALRNIGANEAFIYPQTDKLYHAALADSSDQKRGVSFSAVARHLRNHFQDSFASHDLQIFHLPNERMDIKSALVAGYPVIVGYQVNPDIEKFHKHANVCKYHAYILPRFATNPEAVSAHTVLLIGYDDSVDSFIARNSWGSDWGVDGHFLIRYGDIENEDFFTDIVVIRPQHESAS